MEQMRNVEARLLLLSNACSSCPPPAREVDEDRRCMGGTSGLFGSGSSLGVLDLTLRCR